ncbi:hypothetical protein [Limnohabitans sp.]|uniref:hypothetical protein n=1 Tax=Limnohabitans sp. TaxID=1907725 RepID=UPI00286F1F35|nr:hypothetical protein [Limnohabitans sp.]
MSMLGKAALAMWWDVSPEVREELEHWHAHEHVAERLSIEGFLRSSRWTDASAGEGFFVMYELRDHAVLASEPYVARLNAPTPWSTKMMPMHRNMVRTQCEVVHSHGAVTARHVLTIRCSPLEGLQDKLNTKLGELGESASQLPGIVGLHVLRHQAPAMAATTEQKIRGNADRAADWIIVVSGYDLDALQQFGDEKLSNAQLEALGAVAETQCQSFTLAYTAIPPDVV